MDLRELRAFVAVAEHGGVARAASALYLSPSSVSETIGALETELGVQLFQRLPRGMVVTDVGQAMLEPARRALQEVAATEAAATIADGQLVGRVTIVPGRIYLSPVIELVARFHAEHPLVVLHLRDPENGPVIAELVRSGEADCGVMGTDAVPSDLVHTPIGEQTTALVVPAGHPFAARTSIARSDLGDIAIIAPPVTSPFRPMFDDVYRSADAAPRIIAETDHLQTMLELVLSGVGAAILATQSVPSIVREQVAVVPLEPRDVRQMSLVARGKAPLVLPAQGFWNFAVREFGGHPDPA